MQFTHRITIDSTPTIRRELAKLGIVVGASGFVAFEVDESHEAWPALKEWIVRRDASDFVGTHFTDEEIAAARWLVLGSDWLNGYPQPDNDGGFKAVTYELKDCCGECFVGKRQKASFRLKAEPKWGRRSLFRLHWIPGEFFVKPELWRKVFQPRGIGCRSVHNRNGAELKTVVQLVIEEEVALRSAEGLKQERCMRCGQVKHRHGGRGFFPPLASEPLAPLARTREWFGSGWEAGGKVLISQELFQVLKTEQVRGVWGWPVAT